MKKTSILSLATATALVATTAGTLAVWDTLDVSKEVMLTYGKPVTVSIGGLDAPGNLASGENGAEEVKIPFTVNLDQYTLKNGDTIELVASGTAITNDTVTVAFVDDSNVPIVNGIDNSVQKSETYKAVVTLKNLDSAPSLDSETLSVKATLKPGTPTNP